MGPAEAAPSTEGGAEAMPKGWYSEPPPVARTLAMASEARGLLQALVADIDNRAARLCQLAAKLENDPMAPAAGWDAAKAGEFLRRLAEARRAV
jgi:hypothetical protein